MKTVARYLYPFYDETVPLDGTYVSTLLSPSEVAVRDFIGYDPTKEEARGLVPGTDPVFARRILSTAPATLAPQTFTVTQMTEFATRAGSYYAVEQGTRDTHVFIVDINDPILNYTSFQNVPGGYSVKVNTNHTISISIKV